VRSQIRDCSDGPDPDGDDEGAGEAGWAPPVSDATATAAGVNITAIAADNPIVSLFMRNLQGVAEHRWALSGHRSATRIAYPGDPPKNG
jgi:hypothetical protein